MNATVKGILLAVTVCAALSGCGGAETRKARYIEKGEQYLTEGNLEKASVEFRNALQIDPNDAQARYQVGRISERLGNPRDAVGHYLAAIEFDPKHVPARAALGRLYVFGGLADRALELVEPGLLEQPENAELLTVRGAARAQLGNTEAAFADAERAVAIAPDHEYAVALLASLYRQSARSDKAIEVVRAGLERLPKSTDLRTVLADLEMSHNNMAGAREQLEKVIELEPKKLEHRYRLTRFHVLRKDIGAAEQTLRNVIAAEPESVEVKVALADLLAAQNQFDKAEQELKKFANEAKGNSELQLALGRFYEKHKKTDLARQTYEHIIEEDGTNPGGLTARNRLAAMMLQTNDAAGASKLIDEVLKTNARDNDALVMRGNLALSRGDAPGAIADLRAVLRDQPNAIPVMRALARAHLQNREATLAEETLRAASQANPTDRVLRLELSQLLLQSGRAEQARPVLEQLVSEQPSDIPSLDALIRVQVALKDFAAARNSVNTLQRERPDVPLGFHLDGMLNEMEGKLEDAYVSYSRALELEPNAAEPLAAITRVDVARKKTDRAMERLDKYIAEQPKNVIARNLKGELQLSSNDATGALKTFSETVRIADVWWVAYRGLALAQVATKDTDAAIATLERGITKSRETATLASELAALYERLGRSNDAISTYEKLLEREPRSVGAANNLAMLLVTYRTDESSLNRARELAGSLSNVDEPAVLNTRGWVMFKRGEYQESLPLLQQAVDKSPQSPVMRYHLGMAQFRSGDKNAARENLEAAIATGKPFPGAKEAQAALDEIKRSG